MGGDKAFYIIAVGGGKCLENTTSASGVLDCLPKPASKAQRWVLEPSPDEPNVVAFRSCEDGQYLRNTEPAKVSWARIGVGAERQWWTLERGATPGSCLIRSNACTAGQSYLNDFEGKYQDRNYVHMWQMEKTLEFWLNWYIVDADNAPFNPVDGAAEQSSKALEEREKSLAERAERVKDAEEKSQAVAKREAAAKKREDEVARQEKALQSREAELAAQKPPPAAPETAKPTGKDDAEQKEAALRKREKEVAAREKVAAQAEQKAKSLKAQEVAVSKREKAVAGKEKDAAQVEQKAQALRAKEAAVTQREQALAAREKAAAPPKQANTSATRKPSPAKPEPAPAPPTAPQQPERAAGAGAGAAKRELELLQASHAQLQSSSEKEVRRLRSDAANLRQQLEKSRHAAESRMVVPGSRSKAIVWNCGHKAYPLPRKLERKVVGIIYEGLELHAKAWGEVK
ncbi:hypothetical protein LTR53_009490 [Teratosphaeriaceae sp. CCFEE 6253]|nr:hypothetical protein LTR53_009490 [Teratosphaeriaceae sp. CCFEE 6253]